MMVQVSGFQKDLLYVVADCVGRGEDPNGTTVREELEEWFEESITPGRVYMNLDELAEAGLIDKYEADGRTNAYGLTSEGKRFVTDHADRAAEIASRL